MLTSDIIRPEELGRENIIQQCSESVHNRVQDSRGFEKAVLWDEAIANALNNDLPSFYEPAMQKQAQSRYNNICQILINRLQANLRTPTGLMSSLQTIVKR